MKETVKFVMVDDPFAIDTLGRCWGWNGHKWQLTGFTQDDRFGWIEHQPAKMSSTKADDMSKTIDDGGALGESDKGEGFGRQ